MAIVAARFPANSAISGQVSMLKVKGNPAALPNSVLDVILHDGGKNQ
jgi:hypothetical protein